MKQSIVIILLIVFSGCEGPVPRKPVKVNTSTSIKVSVERSRALLAKEEQLIQDIVKKDTIHTYENSSTGSWFYYLSKNETTEETAQANDIISLTYNVVSFDNDTIYSMNDIGVLQYTADKLPLFPGLRNSVKLLKEKETATFLFPSSLGYGYHGDNQKIGINVPIKSTIAILKIEKAKDSL